MHEEKRYITLQEAAALLGIAVITFRKLIRMKAIEPDIKLGMNFGFEREKILKFNPKKHITLAEQSYPKPLKFFRSKTEQFDARILRLAPTKINLL